MHGCHICGDYNCEHDNPTTTDNLESEGGSGDTRIHKRKLGAVSSDSNPTTTGEQDAIKKIMQHAMSHTGNLLNEFTVREIINAALAAERKEFEELEQLYRENNQDHYKEVGELQRQLATEREKYEEAKRLAIYNAKRLAADRENHKRQIELIGEGCIKVDQQLAAAVEALVELLTEIVEESAVQFEDIRIDYKTVQITSSTWDKLQAWHAAKVKEGK